jgi:NADH-quinone oxidoreductase subunit A
LSRRTASRTARLETAAVKRHFAQVTTCYKLLTPSGINAFVLRSYLPAIVFLLLGGLIGALFSVLNLLTGKRRPNRSKDNPYECGLPSEVQRGFRFGISFYLIAMLFILFDIEVIFIYPIAVQLRAFGTFALSETIVFVVLLMIGFVYVWRRGALEWK